MTLDDYSTRFLARLLAAFPSLAGREVAGPDEGCFTIEVETLSGSIVRVFTEDIGRVAVGIDEEHGHYGGWADSVDEQDFADAVREFRHLLGPGGVPLTEAEWPTTHDVPQMLQRVTKCGGWYNGPRGDRRFLLYGCACCRLGCEFGHPEVVEAAELFADGLAGEDVRAVQRYAMSEAFNAPGWGVFVLPKNGGTAQWNLAQPLVDGVKRPLYAHLLRDVFGNPFRPVVFSPAWRSDDAIRIARDMYDSRDFAAMPVLADALTDAGCDDVQVLAHCRGEGPHVRGCWVIDGVLGLT